MRIGDGFGLLGPNGYIANAEIYRALVCNHAKLAYDAVGTWLEGKTPPPPAIATSDDLARQLGGVVYHQQHIRNALTRNDLTCQQQNGWYSEGHSAVPTAPKAHGSNHAMLVYLEALAPSRKLGDIRWISISCTRFSKLSA